MNVFSVDLEEWFHINDAKWLPRDKWLISSSRIEHNTEKLLGVLQSMNVRATFFIMGWVVEHYPDLVRYIDSFGHDIGYHSYHHLLPSTQSAREFEEDLTNGLNLIERHIVKRPIMYRAPNLSLDDTSLFALPILLQNGIEISSSTRSHRVVQGQTVPNSPFHWRFNGASLLEFPVNRLAIPSNPITFTGGGYFRVMPYFLLKPLFKSHSYNMAYFHPNDIDGEHPQDKQLGLIRNWMNSVGTSKCESKMLELLQDFHFSPLSEVKEFCIKEEMITQEVCISI